MAPPPQPIRYAVEMSVRGQLTTMSAEDVLTWAGGVRAPLLLTFSGRDVVRSLAVGDGHVVWAASSRSEEQLGMVLSAAGHLADRGLTDSLEARAETGVPLAKVMHMAGLVPEDTLIDILATKIREAVTEVVAWPHGEFEITPRTNMAASTGVSAGVSVEVCLQIARRRRERLVYAVSLISSDDLGFLAASGAITPMLAEPPLDARRLWTMAVAGSSVAQIAAVFGGERYAVLVTLADWVAAGALTLDRRRRARTDSARELVAGAQGRLRQGDRAGALTLARRAMLLQPGDVEVRRAYSAAQRARVAEVARKLLGQHVVPQRTGKDPSEPLASFERELVARVDGRWDLLSLIRTVPSREAEALLAFERLAELGVVTL